MMASRSETKRFLFSKASLAKTTAPKSGRVYVYDARVTGLCLCTTASGLQTFYSYKKVEGQPVRVRLGRYPGITIQQARSLAADVAVDIARGGNPQKRRQAAREGMTFGDLCTHWMDYAKSHKRTWEEDQRKIDKYLPTWLHRKASAITKQAVISLHTSIGTRNGHYMANRVLALMCSVFAKAIADDLFEDRNPASSIKKFEERSRDRYLLPDELPRFFQALKEYPDETLRDFFLVALLTGARRGNVLAMHWDDVNLDMRVWRIPDTKNREPVLVPLSDMALGVLQKRLRARNGSEWVFPLDGKTGHVTRPDFGWSQILKNAGIKNLRIHDLRRTLGSWQANTGASLPVIGKSLGHKSQAATAIYARLGIEPVRESVDRATAAMLEAGGVSMEGGDDQKSSPIGTFFNLEQSTSSKTISPI